MSRVTVVGEALVDVISDASGVRRHPGGSPLNVAVGLARLGHASTLVARLGDDADGALLREHLDRAGVDLVPGAVDGGPTSVAEAVLDDAGHAEYTFRLDWRVPDGQLPTPPEHVHTGSIAVFLPPGADQVLALLARHAPQATTSFDPNVRPAIIGEVEAARRRVAELVAVSDVVKVSDEDLGWLEPGRDITAVAQEWREQGPGLVVVTRGSEGAVAVAASGSVHVPAPPVEVVDTVGAGDAFMSGLLDALAGQGLLGGAGRDALRAIAPDTVTQVVAHAIASAAVTCTRAGADPPDRTELEVWQAAHRSTA